MKGEKELVNLKIQKIKLIFALVLLFILSLGGLKFVKTENEEKISSDGEKKSSKNRVAWNFQHNT